MKTQLKHNTSREKNKELVEKVLKKQSNEQLIVEKKVIKTKKESNRKAIVRLINDGFNFNQVVQYIIDNKMSRLINDIPLLRKNIQVNISQLKKEGKLQVNIRQLKKKENLI